MPIKRHGADSSTISTASITHAWLRAVELLAAVGTKSIEPLVVTVASTKCGGIPTQTPGIVPVIDEVLRADHIRRLRKKLTRPSYGPLTVEATANTLFPQSLWQPGSDRHEFYARYRSILPRLKRHPRNRLGLYFERLISFGRGPHDGNQIEHIIRTFEAGITRTSAYQASIVDPERDMRKTPMLGFPCLQQIALHPSPVSGTIAITGFYGTQYIIERGFGNYLGLCRLGQFIGSQMGLRLTRMTCIAAYAPLEGSFTKSRAREILVGVLANRG